MCAEHGVPRSASAPALSASAFFIIFFSKYARASSTGRDAAGVIQYEFPIILAATARGCRDWEPADRRRHS